MTSLSLFKILRAPPFSANFQDAPALAPQQRYFAVEIKKAKNTDNDDNAKFCIL